MTEFAGLFETLKPLLAKHASRLTIKTDTPSEYTVLTRSPSPLPQAKGGPMYFGSVRLGKAYVSFHLMPLYMCEDVARQVTPALKKRMQGKTCFNFRRPPEPEVLADLKRLTDAGLQVWAKKKWL